MLTPLVPHESRSEERLVDDQSAKRILRSAAELDVARRERVTIAELRRIAQEAGISNEAFDVALTRFSGPAVSLRDEIPFRGTSPARMIGLSITGVGLGAMVGWIHALSFSNDVVFLAPLAAASVVSLSVATRYRSGGKLADFISEHLGLFLGMFAGFALWHPEFGPREVTVGMAVIGMAAMTMGLVGAGVVTTRFVHQTDRAHRIQSGDEMGVQSGRGGFASWLRGTRLRDDQGQLDSDQDPGLQYQTQRSAV